MVATTNKQQTNYYRQTTYNCYPIVPGGKSARDKKIQYFQLSSRYSGRLPSFFLFFTVRGRYEQAASKSELPEKFRT